MGWSLHERQMLFYDDDVQFSSRSYSDFDKTKRQIISDSPFQSESTKHFLQNYKSLIPYYSSEHAMWVRTYLSMINVKSYLENNNIPYLFFDSICDNKLTFKLTKDERTEGWWNGAHGEGEELLMRDVNHHELDWNLLNSDTVDRIYDDRFVEGCYRFYLNEDEFADGHPNEKGARRWSEEVLLPKLKELYDFK